MRILLTNDDGIGAAGLAALEAAFGSRHEVWVVAPDGERSGTSHAIHLQGPVRIRHEGERRFSCSGTPADCVFLGLRGDFLPSIDAVLSGINHGPNLGTDVVYSGTCAAARHPPFDSCRLHRIWVVDRKTGVPSGLLSISDVLKICSEEVQLAGARK